MFDYLQKFNSLPRELRKQISSPAVMAALSELENKYRIDLAMIVMKLMIKDLAVKNLPSYLINEFDLSSSAAEDLTRELQDKVLASVAGHLGFIAGKSVISAKNLHKVETVSDKFKADRLKNLASQPTIPEKKPTIPAAKIIPKVETPQKNEISQKTEISEKIAVAPRMEAPAKMEVAPTPESLAKQQRSLDIDTDINQLIKEAGLILPSEAYVSRLKNILVTYLRGIRSKIDTRAALTKDVEIGGLRLSAEEADRIFKVCDSQGCRLPETGGATIARPATTGLDKIIAQAEKAPAGGQSAEYDLKSSLASGQTKPVVLDSTHELAAPAKQLDLPRPTPTSTPNPASVSTPVSTPVPTFKPSSVSAPKPIITPTPAVPPRPNISRPLNVNRPAAVNAVNSDIKAPVRPTILSRPTPMSSPAKPQMHDIKPIPKVMGPIEELQFLDLTNFRRLGKTAAETTAKIFAKIKLLEKDGYDKMVAGVRAWRSSPVNRLYVNLGQEAIAKGVSIKEAVAIRQRTDQASLNMEEIEEIVKLNSRLAF